MTARKVDAPHGLLLAAGGLALVVTALLSLVLWRLAHTRDAIATIRARCECCEKVHP
jgi:hypothetical protein